MLVCDGPLTEELDRVIAEYESNYPDIFEVHRLPENGGLGAALAFGLPFCRHELVARADSDDISLPHRFERQIPFMEEHPELSAIGSLMLEFDQEEEETGRIKPMPATYEEILSYTKRRCPLNHPTVVFRKSDVEEVGSYINVTYTEDYYLWVRLLAAGKKMENLREPLLRFRANSGTFLRRGDKRQLKVRSLVDECLMKQGLLKPWEHWLNLVILWGWCMVPAWVRRFVYERVLRK